MSNLKYKVKFLKDQSYKVIDLEDDKTVFWGSLTECEAWIRLTLGGYL